METRRLQHPVNSGWNHPWVFIKVYEESCQSTREKQNKTFGSRWTDGLEWGWGGKGDKKRKKYPQHVYPTTIWSLYNPKITLRQNHTNTQKPHHYALSLKTISSVRCGHTSLQTRSSFHSQLFPPQPQTWRHTICAVWFFWIYYNVLVAMHLRWTQTKTKTPKHLLIPLGSLQREH